MLDTSNYPFYDDFVTNAEPANYHKILFVPGNAVQARELTQIQSMLQNQIKIQGDSIYQNGTVVVPGNIFYDNTVTYLKIVNTTGSSTIAQIGSQLIGQKIIGQTTGVTAQVIFYTPATLTDPDTLFIKYTGANGTVSTFNAGEVLYNNTLNASVQISSITSSMGTGSICSIAQGIYYVNGFFVGVDAQTIALDKYDSAPSFSVGLQFVENIVTASSDATLYDNALGFSNYAAPGASRYQIKLILTANQVGGTPQAGQASISFISLLMVLNGQIQYLNNSTQYSAIEKMLAQRTYDTNGDFVVQPFNMNAIEYLSNNRGQWSSNTPYLAGQIVTNAGISYEAQTSGNSGSTTPTQTYGETSDGAILWLQTNRPQINSGINHIQSPTVQSLISAESNFIVQSSAGRAYVQGFEINKQGTSSIVVPKARTTNQLTGAQIYTPTGSFIQVTNLAGYINTATMTALNLNDISGTKRGTAYGTLMEYVSGSIGYTTSIATSLGAGAAYISGTTLTLIVGAIVTGTPIYVGMPLYGIGIVAGTTIVSGSGSTWQVSISQTLASSGTPIIFTSSNGVYNLYLVDIVLNAGYDFTDDILSLSSSVGATFSAQLIQSQRPLSGTVTTTATSTKVQGVGTLFTSEIKVGDIVQIGGASSTVLSIYSDLTLYVVSQPVIVAGAGINGLKIDFINSGNYLQLMPHSYINSLRTAGGIIDTAYTVFKTIQFTGASTSYSSTLSIQGETFAGVAGHILVNTTTNQVINTTFSLNGTATALTMTGIVSSHTYSLLARLTRSGAAALQKTKTLTNNTVIATSNNISDTAGNSISTAYNFTSPSISLGVADAQTIAKVTMSGPTTKTGNGGTTYQWSDYASAGESDVTSWFTLNQNANLSYYDVSTVTRSSGGNPSLPLKITYEYFLHTAGDYFSVDSYSGTAYKDIPTEVHNGISYPLRDCLDFRSCIANGIISTPLDPNVAIYSSYSYYQGRRDVVSMTPAGTFEYLQGSPSDTPLAKSSTGTSLPLATIAIKPYTINPTQDVTIIPTSHQGYKMSDIGILDTRVGAVEYQVALNQLEAATANLNIYDANGLTVYKNGFIADNFDSLNVSNVTSSDFSAGVDVLSKSLTTRVLSSVVNMVEPSGTTATSRKTSGYQITGDFITLPYVESAIITQPQASNGSNINPFAVFSWSGQLKLTPSSDAWTDSITVMNTLATIPGSSGSVTINKVNVQEFLQTTISVGTTTATQQHRDNYSWNQYTGTDYWNTYSTTYADVTSQSLANTTSNGSTTLPSGAAIVSNTGVTNAKSSSSTLTTQQQILNNTVLTAEYGLPIARSIPILLQASGMKPFAKLYSFLNGQNINANILPCARITISNESTVSFLDANTTQASTATNSVRGITYEYNSLYSSGYLAQQYPQDGTYLSTFQINVGEIVRYYKSSTDFIAGVVVSREVETNAVTDVQNTVLHVALFKDFVTGTAYTDNVTSASFLTQAQATAQLVGQTIKGASSGATGLVTSVQIVNTGELTTNSLGNIYGIYIIPPGTQPCGSADILLTDDSTGGTLSTTSAIAKYTATGILDTFTNTIQYQSNSFTTITDTGTQTIVYTDPIAETFVLPAKQSNGAFITSVDLFFMSMDIIKETQPVNVQITDTINGYPGSNQIFNAFATVQPANIKTSKNASIATRFYFQGPVYLKPGVEYALKVLTNSVNYNVYVATMGQSTIGSATNIVTTQPYLGSFFQSQNNSTWTANQFVDLTFNINAATFDTTAAGTVTLVNQGSNGQLAIVTTNPFVTSTTSSIVKVNYTNHGLFVGAFVSFSNLDLNSIAAMNLGSATAFTTTVTSVINMNSFTITLLANASLTGAFGGNIVRATQSVRYDSLSLSTGSSYLPTGTFKSASIKPATATAIATSYIPMNTSTGVQSSFVHSDLNEGNLFNNQKSLSIELNISSSSSDLSPIISVSGTNAALYANVINTPSQTDTTQLDLQTIVSAHASLVFNATTNIINVPTTIDINQFKIGTMITISGTTNNNMVTEIINIDTTVQPYNVYVSSTLTAESPASTTIIQANGWVDEIAPIGSTSLSKYETLPLTLTNASSGVQIMFNALIPQAANITLWYRTTMTSGAAIAGIVWKPITMSYTKNASAFIQQQYNLSALPNFNVAQFKIVMTTTDTSQVPVIKAFSAICLA